MTVIERFLKYVTFDTQSDESTGVTPSTPQQMVFAKYLKTELEALGLEEISLDDNGYLFATLPANVDRDIPTIGFIAHMDTSPDMSGENVNPNIVRNYGGEDITLCKEEGIILSPKQFPELLDHVGEDLIVTDGRTLLGADDKAGIAEIIAAVAYLKEHPEIEHGKIRIGFNPDEEIGLGAYVIPKGNVTRLDFEDRYKKKKKQEYVRNVQLEVDSGVIAYIERYENYNKTGYRFSLDKFDDKKLVAHLTARSVTYDTASVHKWTIKNYMIREMEGMREKITRGDRLDTIIKMEPQDFLIMKGQQQTMTSPELKEYIDKQKRRGFANIKEFEIEYYQRIAMSFAAFILTTIGVSLSSRKMKGGMGLHLGVGLALSFSYILFQTVSATFAVNGNTPPVIAVWIPNILYTFIAIYLYRKAPK